MKDKNGSYYYPNPEDVTTRVYVKNGENDIEFRLWHAERKDVWEKHNWISYSLLEAAALMYKERGTGSDPLALYDINVARALIKEEERQKEKSETP